MSNNIINKIELIKAEEYSLFGDTKTNDKDMLLIQHSEHFGFQRACDYIISEIRKINKESEE